MSRRDAHAHLSRTRGFSAALAGCDEVDEYERLRERAAIIDTLVIGYERDAHRGNNEEILRLAATRAWLHPLAFVETRTAPDTDVLAEAPARGYAGWAAYLGAEGFDAWNLAAFQMMGRASGTMLSVNINAADIPTLQRALPSIPDIPILVSHLGLPGPDYTFDELRPLLGLASDPRVHVKVSGLYAIDASEGHLGARDAVAATLDRFGARRLLWGTDFSPAVDAVKDPSAPPSWLPALVGTATDDVMGGNLGVLLGT